MNMRGIKMHIDELLKLLIDLDLYISQHALYISKLERAIKHGEPFEHKNCHQCNFGIAWDEEIKPIKDALPEDLKALVEDIEKTHCQFHEVSMKIDPKNPEETNQENLRIAKDLINQLYKKLLQLQKLLKEE